MPDIPSKFQKDPSITFLSYLANTLTNKQTNKQTKTGKNITSLAEVKISSRLCDFQYYCLSNAMHNIGQSIKPPACPCVQLFLSYLSSTLPFPSPSPLPSLSAFPCPFLFPIPLPSASPSLSFPLRLFLPYTFPLFLPLPFHFTFHSFSPSPFPSPPFSFPSSIFLSVFTSVRPIFEAPYLHNCAR